MKRILLSFVLLLVSMSLVPLYGAQVGAPRPAMPGMTGQPTGPAQKLSEDDVKMLQEVEQEINKFVGSLPAEEQKKFWGEVDELTKVMSTMSEDELVKFMEGVLQEQEAVAPAPRPTPAPTPTPMPAPTPSLPIISEPVAQPEIISGPTVNLEKHQQTYKLIESIILMLNNFLTKTQAIPELSGKVTSWISEGKLQARPGATWHSMLGNIHELMAKLNAMKERDPISGTYKYLDELTRDESLINNLQRIKIVLTKYEPMIDISPFGTEKMNQQTRQAVRMVINTLIEASGVMGVSAALDRVMEKYEPRAKQIREHEEAAQRQALEASRRPISQTPATVAGRPEERGTSKRDYSWFDTTVSPYKPAPIPAPDRGSKDTESKGLGNKQDKKPEAPKAPAKPSEKKPAEGEDPESSAAFNAFAKSLFQSSMLVEDHMNEVSRGSGSFKQDVKDDLKDAAEKMREAIFNVKQLRRHVSMASKTRPGLKNTFKKQVLDTMRDNEKILSKLPPVGSAGGPYQEEIEKLSSRYKDLQDAAAKL